MALEYIGGVINLRCLVFGNIILGVLVHPPCNQWGYVMPHNWLTTYITRMLH